MGPEEHAARMTERKVVALERIANSLEELLGGMTRCDHGEIGVFCHYCKVLREGGPL